MDQEKRRLRQLKRTIKQTGNKRRRRALKRALADHPDEAHHDEPDVGRDRSVDLNAMDRDATRKRTSTDKEE